MIGCVITGHGDFSLGMLDGLEMIAGSQAEIKAIPFLEQSSLEEYENQLIASIESMQKECSEIIIMTDLLGGTPFNISMLVKEKFEKVEVLSGTNLPVLLEFAGSRLGNSNIEEIIEKLIETGRAGVSKGEIRRKDEFAEEDGI
ncbi:PTS sugar transporter subunit IIA [Vagococcus elongatus]|uniref:PTS EIIA type-4 domain-containing protein n=1 Tax=Vagococcus elongatus TaxID=180344 RepID=A0A430AY51_9ENTE|nr:PTS sugar transporter subunit IIA [Vagococcus elongatus]RSU13001.1 hypothetical protein CBF29_04845 [Vagococcus elongatus]